MNFKAWSHFTDLLVRAETGPTISLKNLTKEQLHNIIFNPAPLEKASWKNET